MFECLRPRKNEENTSYIKNEENKQFQVRGNKMVLDMTFKIMQDDVLSDPNEFKKRVSELRQVEICTHNPPTPSLSSRGRRVGRTKQMPISQPLMWVNDDYLAIPSAKQG